jgi:hypothetical protein
MLTHGPSYGGLQEIGMLTLIEEPVGGSASRRPRRHRSSDTKTHVRAFVGCYLGLLVAVKCEFCVR